MLCWTMNLRLWGISSTQINRGWLNTSTPELDSRCHPMDGYFTDISIFCFKLSSKPFNYSKHLCFRPEGRMRGRAVPYCTVLLTVANLTFALVRSNLHSYSHSHSHTHPGTSFHVVMFTVSSAAPAPAPAPAPRRIIEHSIHPYTAVCGS